MTKEKYNLELLFKALADRTRLRLINLLGDSEVCVCFLVEILKISQPKISRHLAYMRRAKIVAAEGEFQAAVKLGEAADIIAKHPVALQLRTLQTMSEISTEKNSTIIFPAQFMTTVQEVFQTLKADSKTK